MSLSAVGGVEYEYPPPSNPAAADVAVAVEAAA